MSQDQTSNTHKLDIHTPKTIDLSQNKTVKNMRQIAKNSLLNEHKTERFYDRFIIFILFTTLVATSAFGLYKYDQQRQTIANLENQSVLPASDNKQRVVIPATNLSIILDQAPIDGFEKTQAPTTIDYLDDYPGLAFSYTNNTIFAGKELKSGIEVISLQYDNRFTTDEFAQLVADNNQGEIGPKINIPNNYQLTEILLGPDQVKSQKRLFASTTSDNYYIISLYNQTEGINNLQEVTDFVLKLPNSLYLN